MSNLVEVKVPDIGDFAEVPVIDLFVKVGDTIKVDDAIVTLESDKATMDVPSTVDGVVKEVLVQLGSKVAEGALLIKVETGAEAVHPYLALETIEGFAKGDAEKAEKYVKNFVKAIGKGLNKVMSKIGISTYMSYTGAQIFEAIGLQKDFIEKYFTGTPSNVEGIGRMIRNSSPPQRPH